MMKPLLDHFGADRMLSASMVTVHAATGSQQVLDRLPAAGATDLRKDRSILNNIILTTTGAAKALGLVIPEMKNIGFIAESVRIPTSTGSLIVLVLNFQDELEHPINRTLLNKVYSDYAESTPYLVHSTEQNVSSDIIGVPKAAAVIESTEIHTRTATINVNLEHLKGLKFESGEIPPILQVPVTQSVIYGWYDNELGSYTNMLGDLTVSVAEKMV
jgi:glyceraldehyde 3-phosphate dehydrogenase